MKIGENGVKLTNEEFEIFTSEAINIKTIDQTSLETHKEGIIKGKEKYYTVCWSERNTDIQDEKEITIKKWAPIDSKI